MGSNDGCATRRWSSRDSRCANHADRQTNSPPHLSEWPYRRITSKRDVLLCVRIKNCERKPLSGDLGFRMRVACRVWETPKHKMAKGEGAPFYDVPPVTLCGWRGSASDTMGRRGHGFREATGDVWRFVVRRIPDFRSAGLCRRGGGICGQSYRRHGTSRCVSRYEFWPGVVRFRR